MDRTTFGLDAESLASAVRDRRFMFVHADDTLRLLGDAARAGWPEFARGWDGLELDAYMADGGRYRRRRYATLSAPAAGGGLRVEAHQPHYQGLEYNRLNGGIARHFAPIEPGLLHGPTMQAALGLGLAVFRSLDPGRAAHVEVHQFRIEARADMLGRPTPEGVHRDGVDFVLVMMVRRENVASGTTEIHDLDGRRIDAFTLTAPGDAALVDDRRALHGVTAITPLDAARPAWRDVLVATYRGVDAKTP